MSRSKSKPPGITACGSLGACYGSDCSICIGIKNAAVARLFIFTPLLVWTLQIYGFFGLCKKKVQEMRKKSHHFRGFTKMMGRFAPPVLAPMGGAVCNSTSESRCEVVILPTWSRPVRGQRSGCLPVCASPVPRRCTALGDTGASARRSRASARPVCSR